MYEAINLQIGDEVLCPVYTFHATVSPMMYLGAVPVFCDSDSSGNISLEQIKARRTTKTKAVIVTHMWGMPVKDIQAIADYCKSESLYLLEDCSHAHGARIDGKPVGSFGDISAWSLQGQKIIAGGEGGILLTDNKSLYNRALLHGHYNKRPKEEIKEHEPLREFYLTGFGLKLRAHPIAIAIADDQFDQLDSFLAVKRYNASKLNKALSGYPFLRTPELSDNYEPSWYAYGLQFFDSKAHGVSKQDFVNALHAEGLVEVDVPGSTGLLNTTPLFIHPEKVLDRLYDGPLDEQKDFPIAKGFYDSFIKIPVWSYEDESDIIDLYIRGIKKVSDHISRHGSLHPEV